MTLTIVIIGTFMIIEAVAWSIHKYVMHGFGWELHKDHHKGENHHSFFELNETFFTLFAGLSMIAFSIWPNTNSLVALGIGVEISIYGVVYTLIHIIFIHQRIKDIY
jgi:beta-carotene 3-hydroxylase